MIKQKKLTTQFHAVDPLMSLHLTSNFVRILYEFKKIRQDVH